MRTNIESQMASTEYDSYMDGYTTGERETIERACRWWRDRIIGFMNDGLADRVIEEFRNAMNEE